MVGKMDIVTIKVELDAVRMHTAHAINLELDERKAHIDEVMRQVIETFDLDEYVKKITGEIMKARLEQHIRWKIDKYMGDTIGRLETAMKKFTDEERKPTPILKDDEVKPCPKCGKEMENHIENDGERTWVRGRSCECGYREGDL